MSIAPLLGRPGIYTGVTGSNNFVFRDGHASYYAGGGLIDGTKSRNPANSADTILLLTPGVLMGKITASGKYAPSFLGVLGGALTASGTSATISAAVSAEITRRIGGTGTVKIVGPAVANGTARTLTATYSAVGATTLTITALGVNEVQTLTFGAAATGGTYRFRVPLANGTMVTTGPITWDATDATLLSNINAALDTATGVVGGIVVSGATPDTILIFTFSGTGYAAVAQPTSTPVSVVTFPTSTTTATVVQTTAGVGGAFVSGSFITAADGSENPVTVIPDGYGISLDGTNDAEFPQIPVAGMIQVDKLSLWPTDAGLKAYIRTTLSSLSGGKFGFSDQF